MLYFLSSVEDTAKQFVAITGLLEGIYFHAITFSDVKNVEGISVLIYAAPLVLWLASLIFALMVLVRKKYGSCPQNIDLILYNLESIIIWGL